ncbi:DGQHR domain-containing protein [Vibrio cyclitrophicus]|uniref:DGQHR domain-containing protein n=1 Tax=Vibrio cyclitrophicus TaxID=47951 RepID=UPI00148CA2DC|nr:DNA sulfur modification protein DndB [Vibrio cyclitrophicus]NOH18503.1 DGQHR domain-containing protein [Vibrio cyclitrophicus]
MKKRLLLPCMRGAIGDWVTYTCLMRLKDINKLVTYAEDIHKNKKLSQLIQRELKKERSKEIGEYLLNDNEAFFNSLVVAIYEGSPEWHQMDSIKSSTIGIDSFDTPDYALECMGYLSLTKDEKIFAIDGQHRLSGIQYALEKDKDAGYQQIPVTFLAHYNDEEGLKRTRRLFTTLNKKAKPVNKAAIISLDEDDICACTTRFLVEESSYFNGDKIKFQANNNVAYSDNNIITTIGNLYDLVQILFKNGLGISKKDLDNFREGMEKENKLFFLAEEIFEYLFSTIPQLEEFQDEENRKITVEKYRNKVDGGVFLYRPMGLKIYFLAMCEYALKEEVFLDGCMKFIDNTAEMDFSMESTPFKDIVWDSVNKRILTPKADDKKNLIEKIIEFAEN